MTVDATPGSVLMELKKARLQPSTSAETYSTMLASVSAARDWMLAVLLLSRCCRDARRPVRLPFYRISHQVQRSQIRGGSEAEEQAGGASSAARASCSCEG